MKPGEGGLNFGNPKCNKASAQGLGSLYKYNARFSPDSFKMPRYSLRPHRRHLEFLVRGTEVEPRLKLAPATDVPRWALIN
jgi:hypothetical protein